MSSNRAQCDRRAFVRGAGTAALLAAAGSHIVGSAVAAEDVPAWDEEADVVILGYGAAGMGAVKAVAENGGTAIVLEKADSQHAGGALSTFMGLFGFTRKEPVGDGWVIASEGSISRELGDRIDAELGNPANWLAANTDVEFTNTDTGTTIQHWAADGTSVYKFCRQMLDNSEGLTLHFKSMATHLIQDETGRIVGVEANVDGEQRYIKANGGVIIATGNYCGDKHLFRAINGYKMPYQPGSWSGMTGDGIFLAAELGAQVFTDTFAAFEWFCWAMAKPSEELGEGMVLNDAVSWGAPELYTRLFINRAGQRFMKEDMGFLHNHACLPFMKWDNSFDYENLPMWTVYDAKVPSTHKLWIKEPGNVTWTYACTHDIYDWSDDNEAEVEKGWIYKADTLEELADMMVATTVPGAEVTVDKEAFLRTVEEYNAMCASGEDAAFGKDSKYMVPLDTPPYYAIETEPLVGYTVTGIETDDHERVLRVDGTPFEGLYACGDIAGHNRHTPAGSAMSWLLGSYAAEYALGVEHETITLPEVGYEAVEDEAPEVSDDVTATDCADGTYVGTANGMGGAINVTIEIVDGVLTVSDISPNNETIGIGGYEAIEDGTYKAQIEAAQSANIDGIAGATVTSDAIKKAVLSALAQASV